jgi:hypothetical protein
MTMPVLMPQSVVPCRHELLAHRAQPILASIMLSAVTALGSPLAETTWGLPPVARARTTREPLGATAT